MTEYNLPKTSFERMREIAQECIDMCEHKDKQYGSSWRARGGPGAFFATIRKLDRFDVQAKSKGYDVFNVSDADDAVESFDDTLRDIVNFMLLILESRENVKKIEHEQDRQVSEAMIPKARGIIDELHEQRQLEIARAVDAQAVEDLKKSHPQQVDDVPGPALTNEAPDDPGPAETTVERSPHVFVNNPKEDQKLHGNMICWINARSSVSDDVYEFLGRSDWYMRKESPRVALIDVRGLVFDVRGLVFDEMCTDVSVMLRSNLAAVAAIVDYGDGFLVLNSSGKLPKAKIDPSDFIDDWAHIHKSFRALLPADPES